MIFANHMSPAGNSPPPEPIVPGGPTNPELEMALQMPPPRQVTPAFKSALRRRMLMPTGILFLMGVLFSLIGGIVVFALLSGDIVGEIRLDLSVKSLASATVSSSEATNYQENKARVYKIRYEFATPDSRAYRGFSFCTGTELKPSTRVTVEYLVDAPELNRIQGMRLTPFGPVMLVFLFFPLAGLIMLGFALRIWNREWRKGMRLFANGMLTPGQIFSIQKTSVRVNSQYRYKVSVGYLNFQTFYYAYGEEVERATAWQSAQTPVRVLYNPQQPEDAVVLEGIIK